MSASKPRLILGHTAVLLAATALAAAHAQGVPPPGFGPGVDDPVVFSFATVGDSRQDPDAQFGGTPDPTTTWEAAEPGSAGEPNPPGYPSLTGTLLPQDAIWLQNTRDFARILRGIERERPNLLFFNGDMIYGYGRPSVPPQLADITSVQGTTPTALAWTDAVFEYRQYAYWRGMIAHLFEAGTYVVPVPGNHETQCSQKAAHDTENGTATGAKNCASGKHAYPENEAAFLDNMGDLIEDIYTNERFQDVSGFGAVAVNGFPGLSGSQTPATGGNNGPLETAETELDYSFDIKLPDAARPLLLHFVVINTDPAGADATAPSDWLAADLAAAKQRAAAAGLAPKYFVFGHKPAYTYGYNQVATIGATPVPAAANGLDANTSVDPTATLVTDGVTINTGGSYRNAFWAVIAHYNATYFCGHEHIVHVQQFPDPTGTSTNTPYQVIVGAGGSPFDDTMTAQDAEPLPFKNPWDRDYGWAWVQVHRSGNVTLAVEGFGDGAAYNRQTGVVSQLDVPERTQLLYSIPHLQ